MQEAFIDKKFKPASLAIIQAANDIIAEYQAAGYVLTLRQLYYQFVARDLIENSQRSYKRLGSVINDGRMAGYIDCNDSSSSRMASRSSSNCSWSVTVASSICSTSERT